MTNFIRNKDINKLGKEFVEELENVLKIRANRKAIYGDSFLEEDVNSLLIMAEGKFKRYMASNDLENKRDSLRDLINYVVFMLCVLNKRKRK